MEEKAITVLGIDCCKGKLQLSAGGSGEEPEVSDAEDVKQAVSGLRDRFLPEETASVMITAQDAESAEALHARQELLTMGIPEKVIRMQDHLESFFYYVIHQDPLLWNHAVILFLFEKGILTSYEMVIRRQTRPYMIQMLKGPRKVFAEDADLDEEFASFAAEYFQKKLISSVFLAGEEFEGEWMERSLRVLCAGRRVFLGKNLFAKGACFASEQILKGPLPFLYLGDRNIQSFIGIMVKAKVGTTCHEVVSAGTCWKDVHAECEIFPEETDRIELVVQSANTGVSRTESIAIPGLPERPDRTTRLRLTFTCRDRNTCRVLIEDLGLGEFYPSSGQCWEREIAI